MIRVGKLMKRDLVCIDSGDPASLAATLMRIRQVGSVFVKKEGQIVGIVTESDIVRKVVSRHKPAEYTPVDAIMTSPVIGVEKDSHLFEAADRMDQARTRHLAVTDQREIVGVLSVRDLLHPVAIDDF